MTEADGTADARLRLIRASAGTGKTYALTTRYLALIRGGADPATVLATTFTRKAAGEVFGRVLTRLSDAVLDPQACRELDAAIRGEGLLSPGLPPLSSGEASQLLHHLIGSLDRVAVSTIDGFFARVSGAFALELGLPIDPTLTDDASALAGELRSAAIESMLGDAADDDFAALITLLRQIHHDSGRRSVTASLDGLFTGESGGLYGVFRQAREPEKWPDLDTFGRLTETQLQDTIGAIAESADGLPRTKQGKPDSRWTKALREDVAKAHARDWDGLVSSGLAKAVWTTGAFYGKPVPEALAGAYLLLCKHAVTEVLGTHNRQQRSTHTLLEHFAAHFESRCREQRVLIFADVTDGLARRLRGNALGDAAWADELAYRLDGRVEHLLVDEFQDTSVDQFAVLWPLIDEASGDASSSRTFFCVGDEKQSIYGWRGGRPELFGRLSRELQPRGLAEGTLSRSYRSSPAVIGAVNDVFGRLDQAANWKKDADALAAFSSAFVEHDHAFDHPGSVRLVTTRAQSEADTASRYEDGAVTAGTSDLHLDAVAERVAELTVNYPSAEVGVLTRTNREVQAVLHALRRRGVPAAGEAGAALNDHPAVGAVLSAMTLADHPEDTVAAFHVVHSPLGEVLGLHDTEPVSRRRVSARLRRELLGHGYPAVLSGWVTALAPACDAAGLRRLTQLARLAERYRPTTWLRADAFVRFVRGARVEDPSGAAVRVMTVHRSKGLEFDVVVLPTLHGRLRFDRNVLEHRADPAGPIDAVYRAGDKTVRALAPKLQTLYDAERQRYVYEQCCTLYVAMTRARFGLELLIPPGSPSGSSGGQTFASLLTETLASDADLSVEGATLYEKRHGGGLDAVAEWSRTVTSREQGAEAESTPWPLRREQPETRKPKSASRLTQSAGVDMAVLLGSPDGAGTAFGERVHGFFECVGFVDEDPEPVAPGLEALRKLDPTAADHAERALRVSAIEDALSRRGAAGLWREHPFALATENGSPFRGVIDRLVWWVGGDEKPSKAEVLDFKTDVIANDDELATRVEHHRPQLEVYRRAAAGLLRLPLERVAARLVFTGAGRVVDV